jgi:hypothetical protein
VAAGTRTRLSNRTREHRWSRRPTGDRPDERGVEVLVSAATKMMFPEIAGDEAIGTPRSQCHSSMPLKRSSA